MTACMVRTARHGDLVAVLRVYAQRELDGRLPDATSDLEAETWLATMGTSDLTVYVAESNAGVVGTATLLTMLQAAKTRPG